MFINFRAARENSVQTSRTSSKLWLGHVMGCYHQFTRSYVKFHKKGQSNTAVIVDEGQKPQNSKR